MKCECKKCGNEWESMKPNPKSCPRCKRYDWKNGPMVEKWAKLESDNGCSAVGAMAAVAAFCGLVLVGYAIYVFV